MGVSLLTPYEKNQQALAVAARNSALEELHFTQLSSEEKTAEPWQRCSGGRLGGIDMFKKWWFPYIVMVDPQ